MRKPKSKDESEEWVKKQVKLILKDTGWNFWMPNVGVYGRSGVSDFLAIKRPKLFMAIETKYEDVVTTLQFKFLADVYEAGHFAFLVDETNIETLRAALTDGVLPPLPRVFGALLKWKGQNLAEKIDS